MRTKTFGKKGILVLLIVCVLDVTGVVVMNLPHSCSRFSGDFPADTAGMVFFRGFDETKRFLSPDTLRRANEAVRLYQKGSVSMIACIGGARPGRDVFGSQVVKDYLVSRGIPGEKIVVDRESFDSRTNWQVARRLARDHGWEHVTLIASPMHNQRLKKVVAAAPLDHGKVFYSAYSYAGCEPPLSWKELWIDTHYEWLAYTAEFILPEPFYTQAVRQLRKRLL
ncbi:MAG: YdcF family protein [Candidatus Omnitrophota bacterium]|jgi:uncharacterized SAM-binding protein YcdF (DUF218 family)